MTKYVFWSALHQHISIALTEDLSRYAQGETFWQAMQNLCETLKEWKPSNNGEESDFNSRLKMYYETGINKAEIFVEQNGSQFSVKCGNSKSSVDAKTEEDAVLRYVSARAKTSVVNTGEGSGE
jgi:hypothetical protein